MFYEIGTSYGEDQWVMRVTETRLVCDHGDLIQSTYWRLKWLHALPTCLCCLHA